MTLSTNTDMDDSRVPPQDCNPDHVKVVTMYSEKIQLVKGSCNLTEQPGVSRRRWRAGSLQVNTYIISASRYQLCRYTKML